jgi:hypothetical protein
LHGALFAVGLPATKGTPQVIAAGISRMREKQNPAVPAAGQASAQVRLFPENRTQHPIIPGNKTAHRSAAIPMRLKLKKRLNLNYKKAKFLLMSLMYGGMPSLFLSDCGDLFGYNEGSYFVKLEICLLNAGLSGKVLSQFI